MTNKDRIILQKTSDYICDVAQFIKGFSFEQFMNDKKTISACAFTVSQTAIIIIMWIGEFSYTR